MIKRTAVFLCLFFVVTWYSVAQHETVIKGRIVDAALNTPVEDANVSLSESGSSLVVGFAVSNQQGEYTITYKGKSERITVSVSGFNLKAQSKTVDNKNQTLNFSVEEEQIRLNEVIVKAPKIRQSGDTLNYNVLQFTGEEDRTIADVLKKMPGIQVRTDGTVLYQNRPINKFYIENLDMLQGRYGIATNNISAKDVATVQVMENHQPVRALIGKEFVNEAALNLKLRDSAKGAFFLKAQAGIGASPLLLSNELLGMYFTRNMQHLSVYKGDNTGRDVTQELKSLYTISKDNIQLREMLHTIQPSSPSIPQQRYLFNDAHTATINNLNKLGERFTLTSNLNFVHDKTEKDGYSLSEYFLPEDEYVRIEEKMNSISRKNQFDADFNLNANADAFYLNNDLKVSGTWRKDASNTLSNQDAIHQYLKTPDYSLTNFFDFVKTRGKKVYKLQSFVGYKNINQVLTIAPGLQMSDIFSELSNITSINQSLNLSAFETRNKLSWARTGRFSMNYSAGLNASVKRLQSGLGGESNSLFITPDSLKNNIQYDYAEGVLSASTGYNITPTMNILVTLPVRYLFLWKNDEENRRNSFLYFDPFMIFNWQISSRWSSNIMYGLTHLVGGIEKEYTNPILLNYRLLMRNNDKLEKAVNHNAMCFFGYKNPFSTFFGSLNLFYNRARQNLLNDYRYNGIFATKMSVEKPNISENLSANLSVGREIEALKSNISLNVAYLGNWSEQMNQLQIVKFQSATVSVSPRILTKIGSFASIQYGTTFSHLQSHIDLQSKQLPHIQTLSQKIDVNIFPAANVVVSFRCDYFRNSAINNENKTMWFGDMGVKYKLKTVEFLLDWNNVFHATSYVISSYADTGRYFYSYRLRPSEVLLRVRFNIL